MMKKRTKRKAGVPVVAANSLSNTCLKPIVRFGQNAQEDRYILTRVLGFKGGIKQDRNDHKNRID